MKECLILEREKLEKVKDLALFYPCSGNDLSIPIEMFSPYVTDLWFVDRGYFSSGHQDTKKYGADAPADKQRPVLDGDSRYKFLRKNVKGYPDWPSYNGDIDPCILSETYSHMQTGREIRIHRRRGYGFSAFRKEIEIDKLGVFFYRGDSQGEGGSGNHWLKAEHINEVCNKLIDGGLIVSDGSDGTPYKRSGGIYREIRKYTWKKVSQNPKELIISMESFEDRMGRRFSCVGYAGYKYGPTMIWQVYKNAQ